MGVSYVFRNPFASSIYPIDALSLLYDINASRSPEKRLPTELLLHIATEAHRNALWEEIRATWTPITRQSVLSISIDNLEYEPSLIRTKLDLNTRRYYIPKRSGSEDDIWDRWDETGVEHLRWHISSADLLYRLMCYFPEANAHSNPNKDNTAWEMFIRHNETGIIMLLQDFKATAAFHVFYDKSAGDVDLNTRNTLSQVFSVDALRLLNAFFETVNGSRRLAFYHPAAAADFPTDTEHYVAVPPEWKMSVYDEKDDSGIHNNWHVTKVSATDVTSFRSLLPDLKYDVQSRKIDRSNGTANLTSIISSALLYYRLIHKFQLGQLKIHKDNINQVPPNPITSVWQIQLIHRKTKGSIIFMDDRGLFDIRAGDAKLKEMKNDIEPLVEMLCSDNYSFGEASKYWYRRSLALRSRRISIRENDQV